MSVFENQAFDDHEQVSFITDHATRLRAIIAIHSTALGPAGGGIRMYPYPDSGQALYDVLRLSRAMTCKSALAGLPVGGGKSVIIGDPRRDKTEPLLEAFGRAVEALGGRYICAEDVGTTPEDMEVVHRSTRFVVGLPGGSGDTSPLTGYGVFHAIRAAVRHRLGRDDLSGLSVAVQGAGNVGRYLMQHLVEAGARVHVADLDEEATRRAAGDFGAEVVMPDSVLYLDVDVLAPCAMGAVLDDETVPKIRAKIVCGGANNQLADDRHGQALAERNILYVPDYVANAGGLLSGASEWMGMGEEELRGRVEGIYDSCSRVFSRAERDGVAPSVAAESLAKEVIEARAPDAPGGGGGRRATDPRPLAEEIE
jgi:leucine dehydrogenase